ncbi:uncharacterized protein SEPMUDRAFT_142704 [Sphaerulina musiva SO2202]|uniref:Uncharacterized protein n=1 Tax=Sphaerulina musiva (strain SO2202) TaxID=692275 RepID=M3AWX7_SPHMS|nr:uncharacterized protein SEPMUDRAFT_142704 [Sphaerulina musiva SO2202]EMF11230.1 hypothetical protein SEPMUDRAFT_142704 [Sphaerulina musiva SO2202]
MRYLPSATALAATLSSLATLTTAQCNNQVAAFNPNLRTMSSNSTWFIVPVPKAAAQKAVDASFPGYGLTLLDVPSDPNVFPDGFPSGYQPVLVTTGYTDDIRISALQIDGALPQGTIYVTYVSKGGSSTPLAAQASSYIAGENGPLPNGLVPAVASPLLFAGNPVRLGQFQPQNAAYQSAGAGLLSTKVAWAIVPNPISGPGVYPEAFDSTFASTNAPRYSAGTFKHLINQPIILPSRLCQRNTYYFNNATAQPVFVNGNVTLGPGASGSSVLNSALQQGSPDGTSGVYTDVEGYSACAQNVGNNPEDCDQAGRTVDPASYR